MLIDLLARCTAALTLTPRFEDISDDFGIPRSEWPEFLGQYGDRHNRPVRPVPFGTYSRDDRIFRRAFFAQSQEQRRLYLDMLDIVLQGDVYQGDPLYGEYWHRKGEPVVRYRPRFWQPTGVRPPTVF